MRRILPYLLAVLGLLSVAAQAQVQQGGAVTPGHAARWSTNGVISDAGGSGGSATPGFGYLTEEGITNTGTPLCINDALISGPYHAFCLGANSLGGGLITYDNRNGAPALPFQICVNGACEQFPFVQGGFSFSGGTSGGTFLQQLLAPIAGLGGITDNTFLSWFQGNVVPPVLGAAQPASPVDLTITGLGGSIPIVRQDGQPLTGIEIPQNAPVITVYKSGEWRLANDYVPYFGLMNPLPGYTNGQPTTILDPASDFPYLAQRGETNGGFAATQGYEIDQNWQRVPAYGQQILAACANSPNGSTVSGVPNIWCNQGAPGEWLEPINNVVANGERAFRQARMHHGEASGQQAGFQATGYSSSYNGLQAGYASFGLQDTFTGAFAGAFSSGDLDTVTATLTNPITNTFTGVVVVSGSGPASWCALPYTPVYPDFKVDLYFSVDQENMEGYCVDSTHLNITARGFSFGTSQLAQPAGAIFYRYVPDGRNTADGNQARFGATGIRNFAGGELDQYGLIGDGNVSAGVQDYQGAITSGGVAIGDQVDQGKTGPNGTAVGAGANTTVYGATCTFTTAASADPTVNIIDVPNQRIHIHWTGTPPCDLGSANSWVNNQFVANKFSPTLTGAPVRLPDTVNNYTFRYIISGSDEYLVNNNNKTWCWNGSATSDDNICNFDPPGVGKGPPTASTQSWTVTGASGMTYTYSQPSGTFILAPSVANANATAIGAAANCPFPSSTAVGAGATCTAANQVAFPAGASVVVPNVTTSVATNAALAAAKTAAYPSGVWRLDYANGNGAPPLFFKTQTGTCAANSMVNDGGSCTNEASGNSFAAQFPNRNEIDVREFGATTVASDNVTATDAAEVYVEGAGGCVFYPNVGAFKVSVSTRSALSGFGAGVVTDNGGCIKGEKASTVGTGGITTTASKITVTSPVDGISAASGHRVNNVRISDITIESSSGPSSASANVTAGLHRGQGTGWQVSNLTIKDFVTCRWFDQSFGVSGQDTEVEPQCSQQTGYPDISNGFPTFGTYIAGATGQVQSHVVLGGQDYSNQFVQTFTLPNGTGGAYSQQIDFSGTAGRFLYSARGLEVTVGGVEQQLGIAYTLTDTSASAPSATIYGTTDQTTLTAGSTSATLTSGTGLPTSISGGGGSPVCNFTPVIWVEGPGIPPGTCLASRSGTSVTFNKAVISTAVGGVQSVTYAEGYVAGQPSCNLNLTVSPVTSLCGQKITITFTGGHLPGNGVAVSALWTDPWGVAAMNLVSGSTDNSWYGYSYGGYQYGVVIGTGRMVVDVAYAQITDILSSLYPTIAGSRITLPGSGMSTVRVAPGYPLPGALTTSQSFILCYISNCDAKMGADYQKNGVSLAQLQHVGYVSGKWYPPLYGGSTVGAGAAVAAQDTIYCHEATMLAPAVVADLGVHSTAAGTTAATKLAIYANDPSSHRPGTLIANTNAISIAGTADQTGALTAAATLPAGPYWFCSLWTWAGAPSVSQLITTSGGTPFSGQVGGTSLSTAIITGLLNEVSYTTAGLYAAGYPASLVGLTSDTGTDTMPELAWEQQ